MCPDRVFNSMQSADDVFYIVALQNYTLLQNYISTLYVRWTSKLYHEYLRHL